MCFAHELLMSLKCHDSKFGIFESTRKQYVRVEGVGNSSIHWKGSTLVCGCILVSGVRVLFRTNRIINPENTDE